MSGSGARMEVSDFATRHPENGHPEKIASSSCAPKGPFSGVLARRTLASRLHRLGSMFAIAHSGDSQMAARLLDGARGGNREAFADLVVPHTANLRRLAYRLTGNDADAEDICQEALLKAFLKLHQFTGTPGGVRDEMYAWLRKIVKNVAIDLLRRNGNRKMISIDETALDGEDGARAELPSKNENPEELLSQRQNLNLFREAIVELPRHLRQVCLLSDVLQYSTQEVATGLGITPMAVRTRLFRARGRLRMTLKPMFAEGSY